MHPSQNLVGYLTFSIVSADILPEGAFLATNKPRKYDALHGRTVMPQVKKGDPTSSRDIGHTRTRNRFNLRTTSTARKSSLLNISPIATPLSPTAIQVASKTQPPQSLNTTIDIDTLTKDDIIIA